MANSFGEIWSRNILLSAKLDGPRPLGVINLNYKINSGKDAGEYEVLPSTKIQYQFDFAINDYDDGNGGSWLLNVIGGNVANVEIDVFIGTEYNTKTKHWDNLIVHHKWMLHITKVTMDLGGITLIALTGLPSYGPTYIREYKAYPESGAKRLAFEADPANYTELYDTPEFHNADKTGQLASASTGTSVDYITSYISIGAAGVNTYLTEWYFVEGGFKSNTGMYCIVNLQGSTYDSATDTRMFGTLLTTPTSNIFMYYDEITGSSHLLYKNSANYVYDEFRLPINYVINYFGSENYDDIVFRRTNFPSTNKFMSLIITHKLEKYIIWQDTSSNIKLQSYNSNTLTEETTLVADSSNPVGYFNKSSETAFVFFCKSNSIYVISTNNFINWSEPIIFIDGSTKSIAKQTVGISESFDGSVYVLYYDADKKPQSKLFTISDLQAGGQV